MLSKVQHKNLVKVSFHQSKIVIIFTLIRVDKRIILMVILIMLEVINRGKKIVS